MKLVRYLVRYCDRPIGVKAQAGANIHHDADNGSSINALHDAIDKLHSAITTTPGLGQLPDPIPTPAQISGIGPILKSNVRADSGEATSSCAKPQNPGPPS